MRRFAMFRRAVLMALYGLLVATPIWAEPQDVNAGEKMQRRAGIKMHHGGCGRRRLGWVSNSQLSGSIKRACFPVPTWRSDGRGAQRRGWEERSHAQHREHGEHRTFPAASTVAG
jgi:hypothetical protein